MKFVLFLIFLETGFEPLAEYNEYQSCLDALTQLEQVQEQMNASNQNITTMLTAGITMYSCIAVPKSYEVDD